MLGEWYDSAMRFGRVDVLPCRGRVRGARGAAETWTERSGLLLRLVALDGRVGQGEASPLPGYSRDDIEAARSALGAVTFSALPELERGEEVRGYLARLRVATAEMPASARFAVETALLDLAGQERGVPLWALFDRGAGTPVPLSALAGGADADGVTAASKAVERGVRTVKVKIAGPNLGRQVEALARIRTVIGDVALRLDANRTFAAHSVRDEFAALCEVRPELVEEPVPTEALAGLPALPVPLALDETLQDGAAFTRLEPHLSRLGCVALVLKPMALGGFAACLELAERARARGLDVTLSHLFDGPVGLAAAAHLALAVASRSRATGLAAHGGLEAWPAVPLPFLEETSVVATSSPGLGLEPLRMPS
jgi:o-succinylbenzoate synthase